MPIASNNTGIMSRRQSFNGKGLTFIEVIFDNAITGTATTPDTKDSTFQKVRDAVERLGPKLYKDFEQIRMLLTESKHRKDRKMNSRSMVNLNPLN